MVKRTCKKLMLTAGKGVLVIAAVYCVAVSTTLKSPDQWNKEETEKLAATVTPSEELLYKPLQESDDFKSDTKSTQQPNSDLERNDKPVGERDPIKPTESVITYKAPTKVTDALPRVETKVTDDISSNKLCANISFPQHLLAQEHWLPVDKAKSMYSYSAYYTEESDNVYVIGVIPNNENKTFCQLWGEQRGNKRNIIAITEAKISAEQYRGFKYRPAMFVCPVTTKQRPTHISLVMANCDKPLNVLTVQKVFTNLPYQRRLTVCLAPLPVNFNTVYGLLINWIEINKLLGVEKFVVYNYTAGGIASRVMKYYSDQGLMEVVQWRPPMPVTSEGKRIIELQSIGEAVALNDCLFRNKQYSEFIANIVFNEYFIPSSPYRTNLIDAVKNIETEAPAFSINLAFLHKARDWSGKLAKDPKTGKEKVTVHSGFMGNRISKLILRTSGVNFTLPRSVPGVQPFIVPSEKIVLHKHPGAGDNQLYGRGFEKALPKKLINEAEANAKPVFAEIRKGV